MLSKSRILICTLLALLGMGGCSKSTDAINVYVVTYTLETQGAVTITNAEYIAPDGQWTSVPSNQTNWADFFTFSGGNKVGFRATGSINGAGFIRMTATGSSTANQNVALTETCTGTTGTMPCTLLKEQTLQ